MGAMMLRFGERVRRKTRSILPILLGSVLLLMLASLALGGLRGHLPAEYQQILGQIQAGELAKAQALLRDTVERSGPGRYAAFLAIQIAQVLVAPIPAQLTGLLGGYLFGFWAGLGLTMLGLTIGSALAVGAGRLLGAGLVRRIVPAGLIEQFDRLAGETGVRGFLFIFMLPVFPGDSVCFVAGLTRLPAWQLVLASAAGRLPGMAVLTMLGASHELPGALTTAILSLAVLAGLILWLYSEEVERWLAPPRR